MIMALGGGGGGLWTLAVDGTWFGALIFTLGGLPEIFNFDFP